MSGNAINEGLPRGRYDVEFDVIAAPTITFENASLNESFTVSVNYSNLDESTAPSDTRALDRFQLDGNLEFTRFNISYNYTASAGTVTTASNLKFYKCTSVNSCNWAVLASGVDSDNNTVTGIAGNLSVFALAETVATTTTTSTTVVGGGGGASASIAKFYDMAIITPAPVLLNLNDRVIVPVKIKNNGEVGLSNVMLSVNANSTGVAASTDTSLIPYLDVNREVITNVTIETYNQSGSFSVTVKAESSVPSFTDTETIYVNAGIGQLYNRTIIVEKIKFVKDLFKENPECLELNEIISQAEDALKENKVDRAIALTETAINACKDLVTSKGKVLRYPVKIYDRTSLIIAVAATASIVSLLWFAYTKIAKIKKPERPRPQKMFQNLKRRM